VGLHFKGGIFKMTGERGEGEQAFEKKGTGEKKKRSHCSSKDHSRHDSKKKGLLDLLLSKRGVLRMNQNPVKENK